MRIPGIPYVQGRNAYSDADGTKYAIAIHNTANDATAEQEASYASRRTDGVSAHFYVDRDSIVQSLDTNARAGHAGSAEGNNHAVAVEITGTNDKSRSWWLANVAWDQLGGVLAVVCRRYGIAVRRASVTEMANNPRVRAFYGHDDMRRAWGGTTHTDPGANFPWDRLFEAVADALNPEEEEMPTVEEIWAAGFGSGATRRTAGQLLADARDGAAAAATGVVELRAQVAELRAIVGQGIAADAQRDAELRALVEQHSAGALDAEDVVRRMGALLSGDTPQG